MLYNVNAVSRRLYIGDTSTYLVLDTHHRSSWTATPLYGRHGWTKKAAKEMVSFLIILNKISLTFVYTISYFNTIDAGDGERTRRIAFVRFIGLARRSWQRREGRERPGRSRER